MNVNIDVAVKCFVSSPEVGRKAGMLKRGLKSNNVCAEMLRC